MYLQTVDQLADVAAKKADYARRTPAAFWISAMMAGAYVGLGIILIFSVGSDVDAGYRALVAAICWRLRKRSRVRRGCAFRKRVP